MTLLDVITSHMQTLHDGLIKCVFPNGAEDVQAFISYTYLS
jgi:hypothetical protein